MKPFAVFLVAFVSFALTGCASISVTSDYDPSTDFSTLKSYRWLETNKQGELMQTSQLVYKRVQVATDEVLASKGYRLIADGTPDFFVAIHGGTKDKINVTDWGYSYGAYWGPYGPYGRNVDVSYYTEATLFVDIVKNVADKVELIWRGAGTGVVRGDDPTPEERDARIKDAVSQILEDFPPKK